VRATEGGGEALAHIDIDLVLLVGIHGGVVGAEVPHKAGGGFGRKRKD
jgi:hypothetical protein